MHLTNYMTIQLLDALVIKHLRIRKPDKVNQEWHVTVSCWVQKGFINMSLSMVHTDDIGRIAEF